MADSPVALVPRKKYTFRHGYFVQNLQSEQSMGWTDDMFVTFANASALSVLSTTLIAISLLNF